MVTHMVKPISMYNVIYSFLYDKLSCGAKKVDENEQKVLDERPHFILVLHRDEHSLMSWPILLHGMVNILSLVMHNL